MINGKKVIALVPARGGSKGLPGKNVKLINGKPLISWTIDIAGKSRFIDELSVSTDSEQIAEVARKAGASVPFVRPEHLATDEAPTIAVVEHALNHYRLNMRQTFHYVVLLEPTSPLRENDDIDNMLLKLHSKSSTFDSIVSLGEVSEHPSIMKRLSGDALETFCPDLRVATRRQDNIPAFFPYGVAYIAKTDVLIREQTFYTKRATYFIIKRYQHYEIDSIYDFLAVETVMRYQWGAR